MAHSPSRSLVTQLVYDGVAFRIEFYVAPDATVPAEEWLDQLPLSAQQKFAALFVRMGDAGKIWNERKFKHLTDSNQIFGSKSKPIASCVSSSLASDSI